MKTLAIGLVILMPCVTARSSPAKVVHRWSFDADASDSARRRGRRVEGWHKVNAGKVELDGETAFVELPIGGTVARLKNATIEGWVTWKEYLDPWAADLRLRPRSECEYVRDST